MLTEEELQALDDWRFKRRMPSRAAAVRELLKRGLAAEGFVLADGRIKSGSFGVTDAAQDGPDGNAAGALGGFAHGKLDGVDPEKKGSDE